MKFLLDTNILIPLEPTSPDDIEPSTTLVASLLGYLSKGGHQVYIHPASLDELRRDSNRMRRRMREVLLQKYMQLSSPPTPSDKLISILGRPRPGSHDEVDFELLAALEGDAVDFLVTEDRSLRSRAARTSLGERLANTDEAMALVRSLFPSARHPPPAVYQMPAYSLDESDPIFQSLREEYEGFDEWLSMCKREHRVSWIIRTAEDSYAGLAIVKPEFAGEYGLRGRVLKACTFKIAEGSRGLRFGELLLKTVFDHAVANTYNYIYLEVFPKQHQLITLLEEFGFYQLQHASRRGEMVLAKALSPTKQDAESLDAFEFHVKFGPSNLRYSGIALYVVPILPRYHRLLFPEAELQLELLPGRYPFGNSIKKAYLCHSPIKKLRRGDLLLFYVSGSTRMITSVGVVEATMVSGDPDSVAHFVGKRTVYTYPEIKEMCGKPVLAILFRQAWILRDPIGTEELFFNGVLKAPPQSIVTIPEEAVPWVENRIAS